MAVGEEGLGEVAVEASGGSADAPVGVDGSLVDTGVELNESIDADV